MRRLIGVLLLLGCGVTPAEGPPLHTSWLGSYALTWTCQTGCKTAWTKPAGFRVLSIGDPVGGVARTASEFLFESSGIGGGGGTVRELGGDKAELWTGAIMLVDEQLPDTHLVVDDGANGYDHAHGTAVVGGATYALHLDAL